MFKNYNLIDVDLSHLYLYNMGILFFSGKKCLATLLTIGVSKENEYETIVEIKKSWANASSMIVKLFKP